MTMLERELSDGFRRFGSYDCLYSQIWRDRHAFIKDDAFFHYRKNLSLVLFTRIWSRRIIDVFLVCLDESGKLICPLARLPPNIRGVAKKRYPFYIYTYILRSYLTCS